MSQPTDSPRFQAANRCEGPVLIALGLTLLLASLILPQVPAVTAMAIVVWGATKATVLRFQRSPALGTIMLLHAGVYLSLYATFVCAILYTPVATPTRALGMPAAFDLAASILPMSIALQAVGASLQAVDESRQ